jgi:hypothetical protein
MDVLPNIKDSRNLSTSGLKETKKTDDFSMFNFTNKDQWGIEGYKMPYNDSHNHKVRAWKWIKTNKSDTFLD